MVCLLEVRARLCARIATAFMFFLVAVYPALAASEKAARFYESALQRFEKNDMSSAVIDLKNAIQQDAKMLSAHLLLGKALLKTGQLKAAEAAFEEAIKLGVNRGEVVLSLAQVYLLLGEPQLVIERIQATGLPMALRVEVLALRATAYSNVGNARMAGMALEEARALDPKSAAPLIAEIPMLLKNGQGERAKALANRAIELAPNNALAWSVHASVMHAALDLNGAVAAYDRALSIEPRFAEARVARASLLMNLKRPQDAEKDLDFLATESLTDPRAAYLHAVLAGQRGDVSGAKAALGDAIRLIDSLPRSWLIEQEHLQRIDFAQLAEMAKEQNTNMFYI